MTFGRFCVSNSEVASSQSTASRWLDLVDISAPSLKRHHVQYGPWSVTIVICLIFKCWVLLLLLCFYVYFTRRNGKYYNNQETLQWRSGYIGYGYIGFFVPLKHCLARRNSPISGWKLQAFNAGWDGLWLGSVLVMSYECCFFLSLVWGVSPKQQVWWTSENSKMILKPLVSGELCFCRSYGEYIKVATQKCIWRMHLQFVARSKLIW